MHIFPLHAGNENLCRNHIVDSSLEQAENSKPNMKTHLFTILINYPSINETPPIKFRLPFSQQTELFLAFLRSFFFID
jgi:hypothetical protein